MHTRRLVVMGGLAAAGLAACGPTEVAAPATTDRGVRRIPEADALPLRFRHVDAVNVLREREGLPPVDYSPELTAAAVTHARDMYNQRRAWHFGSDLTSPADRARRAGYERPIVGENISESGDNEAELLLYWMRDPVSRGHIMAREARAVGLGWYQEPSGKLWWVQLIGA